MADSNDFNSAVSASRASDLVAKKWPDAACGAYGGYPAGPTESYGSAEAAMSSNAKPHQYSPVVTPDPPGSGENYYSSGPLSDTSVHAHFGPHSSGNFDTAASNVCSGDAQIAKSWPDALGGGLGSSSDGYAE